MSDKKRPPLPQGEFQWNTGSNYGMDSYSYDTEYGEGPHPLPGGEIEPSQSKGYANLPDGLITAGEDLDIYDHLDPNDDTGFHLSAFMQDGQDVEIPDLAWLDPEQEQDLERLPYFDADIINDLARQWADNLPKFAGSLTLIPNVEKDQAEFQRSLEGYETPQSFHNEVTQKRAFVEVYQHALRLAHVGQSLEAISTEVSSRLEPAPASKIMARVKEDYGLLGKVVIRASAFPGIEQGRWDKVLSRMGSADFILVDPGHPLANAPSFRGFRVVQSLNWSDALKHYQKKWAGLNIAFDYKGTAKEDLRTACLKGPTPTPVSPSVFEKGAAWVQGEGIRLDQAWDQVQSLPKVREFVQEPLTLAQEQRLRLARVVVQMRTQGRLTAKEANTLLQSPASTPEVLGALSVLLEAKATARAGSYQGSGHVPGVHHEASTALMGLSSSGDSTPLVASLLVDRNRKALAQFVEKGLLTPKQVASLEGLDSREAFVRALRLASGKIRPDAYTELPKAPYLGVDYRPFSGDSRAIQESPARIALRAHAKRAGVKVEAIEEVIRFARTQMSEGLCGKDLDQVLNLRFAAALRSASKPYLDAVRSKHEGLSGHVYVDALAYASPVGVRGCDEGGLKHRANAIPYVKQMAKCSTCVFNVGSACQKYNKPLIASLPSDAEEYRAETIRLANVSDEERTAALFRANHDSSFNLASPEMDVTPSTLPSAEDLSILWGWDI